jgi:peptidoglycan hydrolase-like protein with peptidoglycan-binding domain
MAGVIARHPRESVGILVAAAAMLTIFINALFLQNGLHPAPIFATRLQPATVIKPVPLAQASVAPPYAVEASARTRAQIVTDIQFELSRRGFYDGAADGIWGAQTDAAARDFAQASGFKINVEASEEILRAIGASKIKTVAKSSTLQEPAWADQIAQLIAPTKRVLAIQRALAEYGYGQIRPTGVFGSDTQDAIKRFESDHKMPVTGQISDQLSRALAAMAGRPLE